MKTFLLWLMARFRLEMEAVCWMSRGKGDIDYHDYPDDEIGVPCHFTRMTCKRCGKHFTI